MTPIVRFALAASVLVNAALLGVLMFSKDDGGVRVPGEPAESESSLLLEPQGYAGYEAYYETLLARGFSREATKPVLLARLEMEATQAAALPERAYWRRRDASELAFPLRWSAELDNVRAVLTDVYGADAELDPAFSEVFRPLGPSFSFLTSAQQVQIERLQLEQRAAAVKAMPPPAHLINQQLVPAAGEPVNRPSLPVAAVDITPRLAEWLEADVLFEYRLRESPLAEQLRASAAEFSEAEFRETFAILQRLEESMGDRELYASSRDALRTTLGGRRFAQLWASRDPLFVVIAEYCEKHSLDEETTLTVYEMFNDSQDRLIEVVEAAANDPQRGAQGVRAERADFEHRLSAFLGDDVAQDILRAQIQHMVPLTKNQRLVPR